ncbi:sigma-E processing peptidase SpoIIGA [Sinanaerobacter sp. ZZT-01]|uniref:sigma-E processing peptidase SpoIIGA n=1 Tax=Sinanaerobacter sp. ZZT-01 TaxID=3111540 RepID=UPI002D767D54|nr:sigma-E processing peptidase SpoIIGA [Sinanaerobacter sp. ZZT-01]WRR92599.1 sigma-E processing peptidase SpoIIGA [Sinanaerobacter sp. ZZT-01]
MVIYGEYLFLENFITGFLILKLTGKICGLQALTRRLLFGSSLCGIYSFVLFINGMPIPFSIALKIFFSILLIRCVFGKKESVQFRKAVLVFYLVSFAMGGITIGMMYFIGVSGVTNNSSLYIEQVSYFNILLGCTVAYLIIHIFADFIKGRHLDQSGVIAQVEITLNGKKVLVRGMVDTGNFLADPCTGKPVFLIELDAFLPLVSEEIADMFRAEKDSVAVYNQLKGKEFVQRLRLIPYECVGNGNGLLLGVKPDKITIFREGLNPESEDVILGIYYGTFGRSWSEERYSVLMHPMAIERGIACHV